MNVYRIRFGVAGCETKLVTAADFAGAESAFSKYVQARREFPYELLRGIVSIERIDEELVSEAS